jgi:hypothetical protein
MCARDVQLSMYQYMSVIHTAILCRVVETRNETVMVFCRLVSSVKLEVYHFLLPKLILGEI